MKQTLVALLALAPIACSEGGQIAAVLPSPTVLITASNTICGTQITGLTIDVNYSGPYVIIDLTSAATTESVEVEIERYLANGQTERVARLTNVVGRTRVDVHFNTKYRARARAGSCTEWSPWVDREVGSANPCGDCRIAQPPPPPPPPPDDDDECDHDEDEHEWYDDDEQFARKRGMVGPPPPCEAGPD